MNWANLATIISVIVGIIGALFGLISTFIAFQERKAAKQAAASEARVRKMYEEKCETRCKDLVDLVHGLYENAIQACMIIEENVSSIIKSVSSDDCSIRSITTLSSNVKAIMTQSNSLKRLCIRLNEEHKNEFGHLVFENIDECLGSGECMPYIRRENSESN